MTNAPELYEFALVGNWPKLLARLASHPHEAQWSDKCKNTALHLVCRRQPPLDVVLALIRSNPISPTLLTVDGLTPLHFACYCGASPEVISVLMQTNKDAINHSEKRGKTPLHCTCAGFRTNDREKVVKMLLECYAKASLVPDEKGRTPLSLIFDDYAEEIEEERLKEGTVSPTLNLDAMEVEMNDNEQAAETKQKKVLTSKDLQECFQLVSYLLRAAYHGSIVDPPPNTDKFRILHAAVGVRDCPSQFVKILIQMNPGVERDIDMQGKLPLHVAAGTKLYDENTDNLLPMIDFGTNDDESAKLRKRKKDSAAIIKELLASYPDAASATDHNGKTPFILAIEAGKPWDGGLSDIIDAYPQAFDEKMVEQTILRALFSSSQYLRDQTVTTVTNVFPYMNKSDAVFFIQKLKNGAAGDATNMGTESARIGVQTAMLKALYGFLEQGKKSIKILGIHIPQESEEDEDEPMNGEVVKISQEDLRDILHLCNGLVMYPDDQLREYAGKVIGAVCDLTGVEAAMDLLSMIVITRTQSFSDEKKQSKIYTCYGILTADVGTEIVKGGLDVYQEGEQDEVFGQLQKLFKYFLVDEDFTIRKSACLVVGAVLGRSVNAVASLKYLKGNIIKCMKPTEHSDVHVSLARGLTVAVKMNPDIFRGKIALPILDAALMLSMSGSRRVQMAFSRFLSVAFSVKGYNLSDTLQEYISISEGENGKLMMNLVTKVLKSLLEFNEDSII